MPVGRIAAIVAAANALRPDLVVLLGDYVQAMRAGLYSGIVPPADWARALATLTAPLGVHAVLGNHDWREGGEATRDALEAEGIPVLDNRAVRLRADGGDLWLAGLADQRVVDNGDGTYSGDDDLPGTLAQIGDDAPAILIAHEPDIFPAVPPRIGLTLCGHTHGGQCVFPLVGPLVVPSRYWRRYAYGHIVEDGRHLIVSGGLGCTGLPIRFGVLPEIVLVQLGGTAQ